MRARVRTYICRIQTFLTSQSHLDLPVRGVLSALVSSKTSSSSVSPVRCLLRRPSCCGGASSCSGSSSGSGSDVQRQFRLQHAIQELIEHTRHAQIGIETGICYCEIRNLGCSPGYAPMSPTSKSACKFKRVIIESDDLTPAKCTAPIVLEVGSVPVIA